MYAPANVVTIRDPADERRMPPQSVDAEVAILGGILLDPNALERVADSLPTEAFYVKPHGIIYRACLALQKQGRPVDMLNLVMLLKDHDKLEAVGGQSQIAALIDSAVSSANIDQYAALVVDKWRRRRLGQLGRKMLELQHEPEQWAALYEGVESELTALAAGQSEKGLRPLSDIQIEMFGEIEQRANGAALPGVQTGFADFDAMTQGLQRSDLIIFAGRPSMGKTAICLNIAANIAGSGLPVAVFSLEMSDIQLAYRLTSSETAISSSRLRTGRIGTNEWERLGQGIAKLSQTPIFIDDTPQPSLTHIATQSRKLQAKQGALGMIFVDYLQLMDGDEGGNNEAQQLGKLTRKLKQLARELCCPVVVLSQLSRGVESRTNKRPMMSDLRSSGAIEQDADLVAMLYREEYYDPDTADRGIAEVIITKHRNGPTGTVRLLFEPEFARFKNLTDSAPTPTHRPLPSAPQTEETLVQWVDDVSSVSALVRPSHPDQGIPTQGQPSEPAPFTVGDRVVVSYPGSDSSDIQSAVNSGQPDKGTVGVLTAIAPYFNQIGEEWLWAAEVTPIEESRAYPVSVFDLEIYEG